MRMKSIQLAFACLAAFMALGAAAADGGIKVELSIPDALQQGEALPVVVRVENSSSEHRCILMPEIVRFGLDTVFFDIITPVVKNTSRVLRPDIYIGPMRSGTPPLIPVVNLPPNGVAKYSFFLFYDFPSLETRKHLFKNAGKYSLRATVYELDESGEQREVLPYVKKHEVQSEFKEFTVVPPENEDEAAAFSDMWNLEHEYFLYEPKYFCRTWFLKFVPQLREYLKKYRNTNLGRRAALPLGMAVSQGVIEDEDGDIQRALEELSRSKLKDASALATDVLKRMSDAKERKAQEKQGGANGG